ncbi:MAG: response regulator transcription factor [Treponema sp.]|jgi:DNA-binding NarL/FixJ family response regulator|nr:response regulator transcription factor [Treponema sp.]
MVKMIIVEDQILMRDLLEEHIGKQSDMEVAGVTDDASKAPQMCKELKPNLILIDIVTKSGCSGLQFAKQIREEMPDIKVIVMTSYPEITFMEEAMKIKAHSYLHKSSGIDHLVYVIRSTMRGAGIYPSPADISPFAQVFSEKELAIINYVCQGTSRDEMAKILGVSESMVKQYITSILNKSGFDSISKFAIYAVSQGLIVPKAPIQKSSKN